MKKLFFFGVLLSLLFTAAAQDHTADIDSMMSVYSRLYKFNGSVLVAKQGKIILNKGYGYRNKDSQTLNDANSIYQLGSITKQFTAAVILRLEEEKKLSVNDRISKFFPSFPKGDSITIAQLLTHTSGIYNYTDDRNFMENEVTKSKSRDEMMALFKDKPLMFSPGTSWAYSNSGYSMLGYIIEMATKSSYEAAVRKYLFKPAEMNNSGFDFAHLSNPNKTTGYFVLNAKSAEPSSIVDSTVSYSAGSIYATTGDLYKWHNALKNNVVLSKTSQESAYTPVKRNYGFGWEIDTILGKRKLSHGGGIHGYVTSFSRVPEDDICIVLLSNASNRGLDGMASTIYKILYNQPYEKPKERKPIPLPAAVLEQYVGEYQIRPDLKVLITVKNNGLSAQPTGQGEKFILPEAEDLFFDTSDDVRLQFKRNENKEVISFILMQGGRTIECKKIQ